MADFGISEIALAASLGGAAISGIGAIQQGQAASAAAGYNAQVAANNAKIAQDNATRIVQAGDQKAAMQQQETRSKLAAIKTNQAASGVDVNSGSAVDVRSSAAELGELDAITVRSNAARQAYGQQIQSANETAQSNLDKFEGENDSTAGYVGAAGSFLGGIGSAGSNYANFQLKNSPAGL